MIIIRTDLPDVVLTPSRSRPGELHIIRGWGGSSPVCSCPAASHGRLCAHLDGAISHLEEVMNSDPAPAEERAHPEERMLAPYSTRQELVERGRLAADAAEQTSRIFHSLVPIAEAMVAAKLNPGGASAQQLALVMLRAGELGIPYSAATEWLYVVNGKVRLMGAMVQALVQRSGKGRIEIAETGPERCVVVAHRRGYRPLRLEATIMGAATAGLLERETWRLYPARMLRWSAIGQAGRLLFADVLGGMDFGAEEDTDNVLEIVQARVVEGVASEVPAEPEPETVPSPPEEEEEDGALGAVAEFRLRGRLMAANLTPADLRELGLDTRRKIAARLAYLGGGDEAIDALVRELVAARAGGGQP